MQTKILTLLTAFCAVASLAAAEDYNLGRDSLPQEGVPRGEVTKYKWESKIFPGNVRDYWVYVPAQYDAAKPACVMVFQDGNNYQRTNGEFRVPIVFDNLIHKKEMAVALGVFSNGGEVQAIEEGKKPRSNRSFEYDSLGDQYARFLLEEILPEVGKKYNLTKDPQGRAIGGISSGGICAWTVAWERPEALHQMLSHVRSFTNIRGGRVYTALLPKPGKRTHHVFISD